MKKSLYCALTAALLLLASVATHAQQRITSHIEGVTIFLEGAQITRSARASLVAGEQTINFVGISPSIDLNSLQLRAKGAFTVLSVECIEDFDTTAREEARRAVEQKIEEQETELQRLKVRDGAIAAEIELLGKNCSTQSTSVEVIRNITAFYSERTAQLGEERMTLSREIKECEERLNTLRRELRQEGGNKPAMKSISLRLDAPKACNGEFSFDYYVSGAGWLPLYEIRVSDLASPMTVVQRARVFQNTGEAWESVALTLSSSRPTEGNVAPVLRRYDLDYGLAAPRYHSENIQRVSGYVYGDNEPKAGVTVVVDGTSIGTTTDLNGYYTLALPNGASRLTFKAQGYDTATRHISSSTCNVALTRPHVPTHRAREALKANIVYAEEADFDSIESFEEAVMADAGYLSMDVVESQLGHEYHITRPYTIASDGHATTVDIARYDVKADYHYIAVPKVDESLFLVAESPALLKLGLIAGQASVYLEETYVGSTVLNTASSDDATISLGRDHSITVERTLLSDYTERKALGQIREESISWGISLQNNRSESAHIILYDQIPVSLRSEIEVTAENLSGGELNNDTGIVTWDINLGGGKQRDIVLEYKVRYPKSKRLTVE